MRIALLVAAAAIAGATLTGCASLGYQTNYEPVEVSQPEQDVAEPANHHPWSCMYDPTYNDNWHDDVICTNGTISERPTLREWDDFVTEEEMMASAQEYAAGLNAGQ